MKKTNLLFIFCAIFIVAPWVGARQTSGGEAAIGMAFLVPPPVDLSDLDVRDAQNKPVLNPISHEELTQLFSQNLLNLVVFAAPHIVTTTLQWIESISYLFNKPILYRLISIFESVETLFLRPTRRFVHNVDNLWTTFSVGLFGGCLLLSILRRSKIPLHLPLRL